jgi:hypothetical protein
MDFDSLLSYCIKLNDSSCDKCLVCHIPIENNDEHLKLKCTHLFHKNCIGYKSGSTKCLYCEKTSIPEIINSSNKIKPINNVSNIAEQKEICCKVILKTGPNQGQYCNRQHCSYHKLTTPVIVLNSNGSKKPNLKNNKNKPIIKTNKCTVILKSGLKAGLECGREFPCKYHNKISNININKENNQINNLVKNTNNLSNFHEQVEEHINNDEDLIEV